MAVYPPPVAISYAVIREDPRLEGDLVIRSRAKTVLCVASGGCVALSLASRFPHLDITAFDIDAAQLAHMEAKAAAALRRDHAALNVANASVDGLNQAGELEKVFRLLRAFFEELIAPPAEIEAFFSRAHHLRELDAMVLRWTTSRSWPAAFHACFSDVLLRTTLVGQGAAFADAAGQPHYFAAAFARALRRDAAPENPFLQHVFVGAYAHESAPHYIRNPTPYRVKTVHGSIFDVPDLGRFDVVSLSNLLDSASDEELGRWAALLVDKLRPGSSILLRQLNSARRLRSFFEPAFRFDDWLGRSYFMRERSVLYNRVEVGFRV